MAFGDRQRAVIDTCSKCLASDTTYALTLPVQGSPEHACCQVSVCKVHMTHAATSVPAYM